MSSIITRVYKKAFLWINYYKISHNYFQTILYRFLNILHLDLLVAGDRMIRLQNNIELNYGSSLDLSAVPVTVEIWYEKIYSPPDFEITEGSVVFDIGANIGNFSLYALIQGADKVFAFEPVEKNLRFLEDNIKRNNSSQIIPELKAVAGANGKVVMHVSAVDTAHSITHAAFSQKGDVEVEAVTLETYCQNNQIEKIDFLKIDCEGAEYEIFETMSPDFLSKVSKVAIEHHERFTGIPHSVISDKLSSNGFIVTELPDHFIFAKKTDGK